MYLALHVALYPSITMKYAVSSWLRRIDRFIITFHTLSTEDPSTCTTSSTIHDYKDPLPNTGSIWLVEFLPSTAFAVVGLKAYYANRQQTLIEAIPSRVTKMMI